MISRSRAGPISEERKAWIESGHSLPLKIQSASFQRIVDKHAKYEHSNIRTNNQMSRSSTQISRLVRPFGAQQLLT